MNEPTHDDVSAKMEARLRAAKPQFTSEQLQAAEKLTPKHLFQGRDVEHMEALPETMHLKPAPPDAPTSTGSSTS